MIAQRTTAFVVQNDETAVQEAMRLLSQKTEVQRWVCEVCGMVHTGAAPGACDSCGVATALVQQADTRLEMNSRW